MSHQKSVTVFFPSRIQSASGTCSARYRSVHRKRSGWNGAWAMIVRISAWYVYTCVRSWIFQRTFDWACFIMFESWLEVFDTRWELDLLTRVRFSGNWYVERFFILSFVDFVIFSSKRYLCKYKDRCWACYYTARNNHYVKLIISIWPIIIKLIFYFITNTNGPPQPT